MNSNKIAIIIPYFGQWPEWIELFFYSCEQNKDIDWHFFTDCKIPVKHKSNLFFINISLERYCADVSKLLKINFSPKNLYKFCAIRPFYGHIHKELLTNYDFWGYCDIDIIWGNISKFYSYDLLSNYNVFSTHADRLSAHFAIIRNESKYNELCFKIANWKDKLTSKEFIAIEEHDFSWLLYPNSRLISKFYSKVIRKIFNWRDAWVIYYNVMPFLNKISWVKPSKLFFKEQHTTPILGGDGRSFKHDSEEWMYQNGKIYNIKNGKEYIYLHFMIYKKNSFRNDYFWKENYYQLPKGYDFSKGVIINTKGIFPEE